MLKFLLRVNNSSSTLRVLQPQFRHHLGRGLVTPSPPPSCTQKTNFFRQSLLVSFLIRMHSFIRSCRICLLLSLLLLAVPTTLAFRNYKKPKAVLVSATMGSVRVVDDSSSSVLSELKETIRKQAAEIESLQSQLKSPSSSAVRSSSTGHGGHGAAASESMDDLAQYLSKPFYQIARRRVGWLGLFLISLSLTALIMNGFEHTLEKQLELAYFVPLLAGHGGNTGGQAVGTVLSAISAGLVSLKDAPRVIAKEALSGLTVGVILGSLVGPIAHHVMGISRHVATVIFCTLPLVSTIAATLGSTIPFACLALGLDPSVIAAPAMTSFVDVSGLLSYFLIAGQVFALYGIEL